MCYLFALMSNFLNGRAVKVYAGHEGRHDGKVSHLSAAYPTHERQLTTKWDMRRIKHENTKRTKHTNIQLKLGADA